MAKNKTPRPQAPAVCPVCGEDVPLRARACPECGADHNSGWRTDADIDGALGEAEEDFDYEDFVRHEFGSAIKPTRIRTIWWVTALFLLALLTLLYFWR
ncbi:MAG TPA: zinc ribbon domain-containing protein [Chthoniobacterales bacterium]|nr:zinc ribbon domain-containing protein [Chthoniobacterales bacterium]